MPSAPENAPMARTLLLTALALVAFAANSLLCRLALQAGSIDAASFSTVRLLAGALTLAMVAGARRGRILAKPDAIAAFTLFAYMAGFSFAYRSLSAGTGALILFGAVQLTMLIAGLRAGERFSLRAWCGFVLAASGLVYLVLPGVSTPSPVDAALMTIAGAAWGVYSLRGRKVPDPLAATARNFAWALPMAVALSIVSAPGARLEVQGLLLALASGAITSGLGYVLWYAALRGLSAVRAATVQLAVPPIAAFGGVLLLGESVSVRLALSALLVLGGIALVFAARGKERLVRVRR